MTNEAFDKHFSALGFQHFFPWELRFLGASNESGHTKGLNTLPPKSLWPNLAKVATAADALREEFGSPLKIISAYRSPAYNEALSGAASNSYHMQAMALDLRPINGKVNALYKAAKKLRKAGVFTGGIGRYPSFVHIDVRGTNADW